MAKKEEKAKKVKKTKKAKKAKKTVVVPASNEAPNAEITPVSFKKAAKTVEDRFPASDGVHDILHRVIDGKDVWKIVPKGGSWDDA
ncbi:hypothetical protein ABIF07_003589 [Bradyrhizobium elkanii]|uniref:hypothetical protein n=1 Tax=Bradyrhizobium elkanii TaxID=29448 RepID=UPI0021686C5E|nr:hypothetical protein [Bradyrhizobium elkanii]MCS3689385.1 hypothetical protein [Bradyrhizobium elkanii]